MNLSHLSSEKFRWLALVFLSLGLAIVIIDNTVLNVAIPYILRDLHTSFDQIQWVASGYALIIATILITVGRLGDLFGRKKIFLLGTVFFAIGSLIASFAPNFFILFFGEAFIEAIGAAMMLTSSLALLVSEFQGKERALAFGVWGSVAGAAASIGPLLGGFFTTYYSWRWSLRINVIVTVIAILGSVFIKESQADQKKQFDWGGTFLSGLTLFSLVFACIEGQNYGWLTPQKPFMLANWQWPLQNISIIPFIFSLAAIFLIVFITYERKLEKENKSPLLKMSLFRNVGFSAGLATLCIATIGQFGLFFIMPIYLQNVLGMNALQTGLVFLPLSLSIAVLGPLSGFIAARTGPKWVTSVGMFISCAGVYLLMQLVTAQATGFSLIPGFLLFGIGFGLAVSQMNNIILSSVPIQFAGEASAANATMRQVGTSIGIALIGVVLASTLLPNIARNIQAEIRIPASARNQIEQQVKQLSIESGQKPPNSPIGNIIKNDINAGLVQSSRSSLLLAFFLNLIGAFCSLLIPNTSATAKKKASN